MAKENVQSGAGPAVYIIRTVPFAWEKKFEKDVLARQNAHGDRTPPGPLTMMLARQMHTCAGEGDYEQVERIASALLKDPGAPKLFTGEPVQQVVAGGLLALVRRMAAERSCPLDVHKNILNRVLELYYRSGLELVELARDPCAPQELAFAAAATLYAHKDRAALERLAKAMTDPARARWVRQLLKSMGQDGRQ